MLNEQVLESGKLIVIIKKQYMNYTLKLSQMIYKPDHRPIDLSSVLWQNQSIQLSSVNQKLDQKWDKVKQ